MADVGTWIIASTTAKRGGGRPPGAVATHGSRANQHSQLKSLCSSQTVTRCRPGGCPGPPNRPPKVSCTGIKPEKKETSARPVEMVGGVGYTVF